MTIRLPNDGGQISWSFREIAGEPGNFMVKTEQECDPIVEHMHSLRNSDYTGNLSFGRHVASIPHIIYDRWLKESEVMRAGKAHPEYQKVLFAYINQYSKLKAVDERLGKI